MARRGRRPAGGQDAGHITRFASRALGEIEAALAREHPCPRGDACPACTTAKAARVLLDEDMASEAAVLVLTLAVSRGGQDDAPGLGFALAGLAATPSGEKVARKFGLLDDDDAPDSDQHPVIPDPRVAPVGSRANPVDAERVAVALLGDMRAVQAKIAAEDGPVDADDPSALSLALADALLRRDRDGEALAVLLIALTDLDADEECHALAALLRTPVGRHALRVARDLDRPERDN